MSTMGDILSTEKIFSTVGDMIEVGDTIKTVSKDFEKSNLHIEQYPHWMHMSCAQKRKKNVNYAATGNNMGISTTKWKILIS